MSDYEYVCAWQTDRQTDTQTIDRETKTDRQRQTHRHIDTQTQRQTDTQPSTSAHAAQRLTVSAGWRGVPGPAVCLSQTQRIQRSNPGPCPHPPHRHFRPRWHRAVLPGPSGAWWCAGTPTWGERRVRFLIMLNLVWLYEGAAMAQLVRVATS